MSFSSVSFGISFEHAVQLPFTVFLYSPFPDNYAFLSLSPSQIKNIQSADTVPVHGHSPLVRCRPMPVPGLSLLGLKRIRGFASILHYINPTIIIIIIYIHVFYQELSCLCSAVLFTTLPYCTFSCEDPLIPSRLFIKISYLTEMNIYLEHITNIRL